MATTRYLNDGVKARTRAMAKEKCLVSEAQSDNT